MIRFLIICLFLCGFSSYVNAQSQQIEGTVYAFNKYPLKNISVTSKKTKKSTLTDENGKFIIDVAKHDQIILEANAFEKLIYRPKEGQKSMQANLIFQDKKKNRELAIHEGYISKENLEYGLKNLANENNVYSSFTNVYDAVVYAIPL